MTNAERIAALRHCGKNQGCDGCPLWSKPSSACSKLLPDAADALEAACEMIDDCVAAIDALDDSNDAYIKENERLKKQIAEMEKSYEWKAYAALEERIEGYKTRIEELEAQLPKQDSGICMTACGTLYVPNYDE